MAGLCFTDIFVYGTMTVSFTFLLLWAMAFTMCMGWSWLEALDYFYFLPFYFLSPFPIVLVDIFLLCTGLHGQVVDTTLWISWVDDKKCLWIHYVACELATALSYGCFLLLAIH